MKLRFNAILCFTLLGLTCLALPAASKADSFDWNYQGTLPGDPSGLLYFGTGELTTTDGVITELSGTFDGLAISALLAPGAFAGNDNLLLLPADPWYLTSGGFSFLNSAGAEFNIYGGIVDTACSCGPSGCYDCTTSNIYGTTNFDSSIADAGNFTVTPITTDTRAFNNGNDATSRARLRAAPCMETRSGQGFRAFYAYVSLVLASPDARSPLQQ